MVPKSDHLANPRFDKKPSAQAGGLDKLTEKLTSQMSGPEAEEYKKLV